jgi:hypothetical protein
MMLAIIAYNVPAFASSVVSGMLSSNGGAAATAMNAAAGTAMAMAQSMHNISEGMAEKKEAKKEAKDAEKQDQAKGSYQGGAGGQKSEAPNAAVPTPLGDHTNISQQSKFGSDSSTANSSQASANGKSTTTSSNGFLGNTPMAGGPGATNSAGSTSDGATHQAPSTPQARINGSSGDGNGKTKTAFEQMRADHDGAYGPGAANKTPEERDELRKAFHQDQQKALDDADKKIRDGVDGLGKSLEQMLLPAGSQSSGSVSGAQLKSSI